MTVLTHERATVRDAEREAPLFVEDLARYRFAAQYVADRAVLDIACGSGYGSALLRDEGRARTVYGYDCCAAPLMVAMRHHAHHAIFFGQAAAEAIPAKDHSLDVAVSLETFEHVKAPMRLLAELRRVLKPDGLAIISTPVNESEGRFSPENPFHVREYSSAEFQGLVATAFPCVEIYSQLTDYADGLPPALQALPRGFRWTVRTLMGLPGRHAIFSRIVRGVDPRAAYQIAVAHGTVTEKLS